MVFWDKFETFATTFTFAVDATNNDPEAANTAPSAASSAAGPAGVIDGTVEGAGGKLGEVGGASAASLLSVKEIDTLEEKILAAADLSDLRQMLQGGGSDAPDEDDSREVEEGDERWLVVGNDTRSLGAYLKDTASFMATEPFCIWVSELTVSRAICLTLRLFVEHLVDIAFEWLTAARMPSFYDDTIPTKVRRHTTTALRLVIGEAGCV